jgi:acyl carrier protein
MRRDNPVDTTERRPLPSRADALETVRAQLRKVLGLHDPDLPESEHLDQLPGADSVRLMQVVAGLEDELGVEFDDTEIRRAATVGNLTDLVVAAVAEGRPS